jgi:hypothetical protein
LVWHHAAAPEGQLLVPHDPEPVERMGISGIVTAARLHRA